MDISKTSAWLALKAHRDLLKETRIEDLFARDPDRFDSFSLELGLVNARIFLDYSKNLITAETRDLLTSLARQAQLPGAIEAMFEGKTMNRTEGLAVLHTALRSSSKKSLVVDGEDVRLEVSQNLQQMFRVSDQIRAGERTGSTGKSITDVVYIGIGGSFLGPKTVITALSALPRSQVKCHLVANLDGAALDSIISLLRPETTLFILVSKSFGTLETLTNGRSAMSWLQANGISKTAAHFLAVTGKREAAVSFGVAADDIFPIWDWVGGRFSLWSAVGLPLCITYGTDVFLELLRGAALMDEHFRTADLSENLPAMLALVSIWVTNFQDKHSHLVLPYVHRLKDLPAYLQQLEMESNGKSVTAGGDAISYDTAPMLWGGEGTNSQHAFHQLLLQGVRSFSSDFILTLEPDHSLPGHHEHLVANCLAQSRALMSGQTEAAIAENLVDEGMDALQARQLARHKQVPGNHPSNTIVLDRLSPITLGALIALYEHKVFCQGVIWQINSFDQWGVEFGKNLSVSIHEQIVTSKDSKVDSSTSGLIALYKKHNNRSLSSS